jgi:RND family efflux transporter MFP subunit
VDVTRLTLCLLLIVAAACSRRAQDEQPADTQTIVPVVAQPVTTGSLRAVVHASGVVTPAQGAEFLVTAPEPATVAEVTRNEGEAVASGDVLVRFDLPGANDSVARQRAEVARTQALLESARIAQSRARDLFGRGFISRRELENADRELADAEGAVARAQAALTTSEAAAGRAIVRAPFSGVVARRFHNPGDFVQGAATDPVLRLVDPRGLEITATIPAADAPRVLQGATARLAAGADATPIRLLVASRPAPGPTTTGDSTVRLTFVDPVTLPVDSPVAVDIDAEERTNVVLIPAETLLTDSGRAAVFVAVGGRAVRRAVTTGIVNEERVEITSGLKPGELIVTQGQAGLADGDAISVDLR